MSASQFPEKGILWRDWSEETLRTIEDKKWPVLLFVADPDPIVWPFLRAVLEQMPANARLRTLLHESFLALFIKADALPEHLKALGAGSRYHIAILSPYGLTPMITIDPVSGKPEEVVSEIVLTLERLIDTWRS
jgi:hypothetical protein